MPVLTYAQPPCVWWICNAAFNVATVDRWGFITSWLYSSVIGRVHLLLLRPSELVSISLHLTEPWAGVYLGLIVDACIVVACLLSAADRHSANPGVPDSSAHRPGHSHCYSGLLSCWHPARKRLGTYNRTIVCDWEFGQQTLPTTWDWLIAYKAGLCKLFWDSCILKAAWFCLGLTLWLGSSFHLKRVVAVRLTVTLFLLWLMCISNLLRSLGSFLKVKKEGSVEPGSR